LVLFSAVAWTLSAFPAQAAPKAIRFGRLLGLDGRLVANATVLADVSVVVNRVRWVMKDGAVVVDRR
jgi:hypothetical protein